MPPATQRDPRSIITPDAFEVAEHLVGMPLASPRRRAVALAIDGVVIGIITGITQSFGLILGVVAAGFFMRAGFKRTEVRNSVFGRAMRISVGCLGVIIALGTATAWVAVRGYRAVERGAAAGDAGPAVGAGGAVQATLEAIGLAATFDQVETLEQAEDRATDFIRTARTAGADDDEIEDALLALVPEGATWGEDWDEAVEALLAGAREGGATLTEEAIDARDRVADLSDAEALAAYAEVLTDDAADPGFRDALARRVAPVVASDTIGTLEALLSDRDGELRRARAENRGLEAALDERDGGGVFDWIRERLDDLGFGFGWAALYMTIFLSWWNGQTIGKRVMRVRVVRLDGEPINWWTAFERAGGYAAGLATGLLGFAQVWWDANRQAIHDRIVGTVVVQEGAAKVEDWESAL